VPIPRSLLSREVPTDHDLRVTGGTWPAGLRGELVISAPHPATFDGPHPFFGEGMTLPPVAPARHATAPAPTSSPGASAASTPRRPGSAPPAPTSSPPR
jgi:hypothetical protein